MARQRLQAKVNQFVGGLNTEANPLSYPENVSFDEQNMALNPDGSRSRRSGFGLETNYTNWSTGISGVGGFLGRGQFTWKNPGGYASKELLVVQLGNVIVIHDMDLSPISSGRLAVYAAPTDYRAKTFSYAVVDGLLVMVTGEKQPYIFDYSDGVVTMSRETLLIRDFFGVVAEDAASGKTLTSAQNLSYRPTWYTSQHIYNLRNQTFAYPRAVKVSDDTVRDPISWFRYQAEINSFGTLFPSNADSIIPFLYPDTEKDNKTIERYDSENHVKNPLGTGIAPRGFFIIDALNRGASRKSQAASLYASNSNLQYNISYLPSDITPRGPSTIAQYAGRIWYGGFSGEIFGGDDKSPRMSSYLLYSRVVEEPSQVAQCYQEADPTSTEDGELVDYDGGFLKIDGAYNIFKVIANDSSLFVLAENGVWRVVGNDGDSFRATGYSVIKLTDNGCISTGSVVEDRTNIFYWGEDDIFVITQNKTGDWVVENLTENSVRAIYEGINSTNRATVSSYYDAEEYSIRWIYGNSLLTSTATHELVLNTKFGAFTKNKIPSSDTVIGPSSISGGKALASADGGEVLVGGVVVTSNGEDVTLPNSTVIRSSSEAIYCIVTRTEPLRYSFGGYKSGTVYDWDGTDTEAYLTTGPITAGDARTKKDVPYLTTHFESSEGDSGTGDESSCLISTRWNWTEGTEAGKWSAPRQAYRRVKPEIGDRVVSTRNKVRGSGRSVSFHFQSEEGKPFTLYGWEFNLNANKEE